MQFDISGFIRHGIGKRKELGEYKKVKSEQKTLLTTFKKLFKRLDFINVCKD